MQVYSAPMLSSHHSGDRSPKRTACHLMSTNLVSQVLCERKLKIDGTTNGQQTLCICCGCIDMTSQADRRRSCIKLVMPMPGRLLSASGCLRRRARRASQGGNAASSRLVQMQQLCPPGYYACGTSYAHLRKHAACERRSCCPSRRVLCCRRTRV